jgi:CubicO group peptidase (beta-lactamase class C family)/pimeloyl-ACP methyl ester carboxylesterase
VNSLIKLLAVGAVLAVIVLLVDTTFWLRYQRMPDNPVNTVDWYGTYQDLATEGADSIVLADPAERSISAAALESAAAYAKEKNSYSFLIFHRGKLQLEQYSEDFDSHRMTDSQSMHKPLVPLLIGAAIEDGYIKSIDDELAQYIDEWANDPRGEIKLRDLLYMESGLNQPQVTASAFADGTRAFLTSDIEAFILDLKLEREPGSSFNFNFLSTQLLSLVIERASGKTYADYLSDRIWKRIDGGKAQVRLDREGGNAHTFCCINVTARGWLQVGRLIMNRGKLGDDQIIPADWIDKMQTSSRAANMGMLVWLVEPQLKERVFSEINPRARLPISAPYLLNDLVFLEGRGGQRVYVSPSRELVVVRAGEIRMEWDDAYLMNLIAAGLDGPEATVIDTPDYTQLSSWAAHPDENDAADLVPTGKEANQDAAADVFYIHPTTFRTGKKWNAAIDDKAVNAITESVIAGQASAFNDCCNVYAPRYRQASIRAVFDQSGKGQQAYDLAYQDVHNAFETFLARTGDRPFIIAGHSQGGLHAKQLLVEIAANEQLRERLVAGYVVGIGIPGAVYAAEFQHLSPCDSATATGCIASWNTFANSDATSRYRNSVRQIFSRSIAYAEDDSIQCTNPLTWNDAEAAVDQAISANVVTVPINHSARLSAPESGVAAECTEGALVMATNVPESVEPLSLPGGVLHLADYALFYMNIRENATQRVRAWSASSSLSTQH